MNRLFMGLPRSGKSYHSVTVVLDALRQARVVVTNLALNVQAIEKLGLPGVLVIKTEEELRDGEFFFQYPGAVFVIDEARQFLPAGIQQKHLLPGWDKLLSEHGHYEDWRGRSSEVLLITQCGSQLPKCVRSLIDQSWVFEKLNKVGLSSCYRKKVYSQCQSLLDLRKGDVITEERGKYKREIYSLYSSHSKKKSEVGGFCEVGDGGTGNVLKGSVAWRVGLFVVVGLGSLYALSRQLGEPAPKTADGQVASAPVVRGQGEAPAEPRPRTTALTERPTAVAVAGVDDHVLISGFWIAGDRCGAVDPSGHRVVINDCAALRDLRTVPAVRVLPETPSASLSPFALAGR